MGSDNSFESCSMMLVVGTRTKNAWREFVTDICLRSLGSLLVKDRRETMAALVALIIWLILFQAHSFPTQHRTAHRSGRLASKSAVSASNVPPPTLTILIPAYNEQDRIGPTLKSLVDYLDQCWNSSSSILVVDDGSTDATADAVRNLSKASKVPMDCLTLDQNSGKGAALAEGMTAIGDRTLVSLILTTDADGSADIASLKPMLEALTGLVDRDWSQPALVNGYRTYASASPLRLVFRWGFRTLVKVVCGDLRVRDSQCGFKLMTAAAAVRLYDNLHLPSWSHDVEVLYRAREWGVPVAETPVEWEDKQGSKLTSSPGGLVAVIFRMLFDVLRLRLGYLTGQWH